MNRSLYSVVVSAVTFAIAAMGQPLHASPPAACCAVTALDSRTGIVTAKVTATSATFEFKVTNTKLLATLHPGSPVFANFKTKQVSLDGTTACCAITSGPSAPAPLPIASRPAGAEASPPASPPTNTNPPPSSGTSQAGSKLLVHPNSPALERPMGGANSVPPMATPAFTPAGAAYTPAQLASGVKIADTVPGAVIYYTTDGSAPTTSSTKYSGAIPVRTPTTIKAMATASGMTNSAIAEASYSICPAVSVLEGVDVSHYNGTVDWKKVRASGRTFAYAEATESTEFVDPTFAQNHAAIKAAGLVGGAYHRFHSNVDPIAQANHFISVIGALQPGDLPPVLDLETTDGQSPATIVANATTWMAHVKSATSRTPILYISPSIISTLNLSGSDLLNYPVWIPNWGVSCPDLGGGWQKWTLWQYTDSGAVTGVTGQVDLNRFNGTLAELKSLAH